MCSHLFVILVIQCTLADVELYTAVSREATIFVDLFEIVPYITTEFALVKMTLSASITSLKSSKKPSKNFLKEKILNWSTDPAKTNLKKSLHEPKLILTHKTLELTMLC